MVLILNGDCLEKMKSMADNTVDSIVTDPPYGIKLRGNKWDYNIPSVEIWREALRVLKHGGHLLSFAGSRTYHRMAINIEDAGFEIRDQIMWVYSSGFPKSYNVAKNGGGEEWKGWGTTLKPAHEPIVVARKPLVGTIVANVIEYGTGGLNIDACRIPTNGEQPRGSGNSQKNTLAHGDRKSLEGGSITPPEGRFPANIIFDEEAGEILNEQSKTNASRFFYCSKTSKAERNEGLENNKHPTVKPIALMKYLCRLVTPPNGVVLDPFMGSGTTGIAAVLEGFNFTGIERDDDYYSIAHQRINYWLEKIRSALK
jgi:DNA modification methylase